MTQPDIPVDHKDKKYTFDSILKALEEDVEKIQFYVGRFNADMKKTHTPPPKDYQTLFRAYIYLSEAENILTDLEVAAKTQLANQIPVTPQVTPEAIEAVYPFAAAKAEQRQNLLRAWTEQFQKRLDILGFQWSIDIPDIEVIVSPENTSPVLISLSNEDMDFLLTVFSKISLPTHRFPKFCWV